MPARCPITPPPCFSKSPPHISWLVNSQVYNQATALPFSWFVHSQADKQGTATHPPRHGPFPTRRQRRQP
eukprot:365438-Chlamydomonas_euryale.AAC.15